MKKIRERFKKRNEEGFGLLEMVVAMGLMAILFLPLATFEVSRINRQKAAQDAAVETAAAETLKRGYDALIDKDPKTDPLRAVDYHNATDTYNIEVVMEIERLQCVNVKASNARGVEAERRLCADFPVFDEEDVEEKLDAFGNPL